MVEEVVYAVAVAVAVAVEVCCVEEQRTMARLLKRIAMSSIFGGTKWERAGVASFEANR